MQAKWIWAVLGVVYAAFFSWYTSFGLLDDVDNRRVLSNVRQCLRPGGAFLLDVPNRDLVVRDYQSAAVEEKDGWLMVDSNRFDAQANRSVKVRRFVREGKISTHEYSIRLFTFTELSAWLVQAGFQSVRGFGIEGEPFGLGSKRMLMVARIPRT